MVWPRTTLFSQPGGRFSPRAAFLARPGGKDFPLCPFLPGWSSSEWSTTYSRMTCRSCALMVTFTQGSLAGRVSGAGVGTDRSRACVVTACGLDAGDGLTTTTSCCGAGDGCLTTTTFGSGGGGGGLTITTLGSGGGAGCSITTTRGGGAGGGCSTMT